MIAEDLIASHIDLVDVLLEDRRAQIIVENAGLIRGRKQLQKLDGVGVNAVGGDSVVGERIAHISSRRRG